MAAQPDFWDNQEQAQKTLQTLNECKSYLEQLNTWTTQLGDIQTIAELLEVESDPALLTEAQETAQTLAKALDQWELQRLLSGPYDKNSAVVTINAGAGGTDAQDWAEMLLLV